MPPCLWVVFPVIVRFANLFFTILLALHCYPGNVKENYYTQKQNISRSIGKEDGLIHQSQLCHLISRLMSYSYLLFVYLPKKETLPNL